jgi:hypothetical protein
MYNQRLSAPVLSCFFYLKQTTTLAALTRLTHLKLSTCKQYPRGSLEEALASLTGLHSLHVRVTLSEGDQAEIVPLQVRVYWVHGFSAMWHCIP